MTDQSFDSKSPKKTGKVTVYILTDDSECPSVVSLNKLFLTNPFKIEIVTQKTPHDLLTSIANYSEERRSQIDESHRVAWCLKESAQKCPGDFILILKDSSVTHASAGSIESIIQKIITSGKWHLCYLCKWMDRCDIYSDKKEIHGRSAILAKTQAPHGIQALLISPEGRDILLGEKPMKNGKLMNSIASGKFGHESEGLNSTLTEFILKGYLDAICVVPNLFDFDITKATKSSDYLKAMECLPPPKVNSGDVVTAGGKVSSFVVLVVILLLIALGLFMLIGGK